MAPPYPGEEGVKPPRRPADVDRVTARALSLLAAFASPVFMAAAIAGWLSGFLPATPLTLGVAAFLVIGGPVLGIVHVASSRDDDEVFEDETVVIDEPPVPVAVHRLPTPPIELTPRAAAAQRFAAWRDGPAPVLQRRA
jgi:hypothetical protein